MSPSNRNRSVPALISVVALLTFLYSFLVVKRPLAWVGSVAMLFTLYLGWRFVRAVERIADALED